MPKCALRKRREMPKRTPLFSRKVVKKRMEMNKLYAEARDENRKRNRTLKQAKDRKNGKGRKGRPSRAAVRALSAATKELVARELCRRSLLSFTRRFTPGYSAGWVHKDICKRLERFIRAVEDGKSPRLMISMPPRAGKTQLASKMLPAWALGHHPSWEIIAASYGVSLPVGFSRVVKRVLQNATYQAIFPDTAVDESAQATTGWLTTEGGGYLPAGVMGPITGRGAHCLILDDLVKDSIEADSEVQRDRVWDWYGSVAKTRLAPGGGIIYIGTRWHDDDISGRLLAQEKELIKGFEQSLGEAVEIEERARLRCELAEIDHWEVIKYKAVAEHDEWLAPTGGLAEKEGEGAVLVRKKGEALHPERFPLSALRNLKRSMQPRHWSALYQQNPVPDEGSYFRVGMFRVEEQFDPRDCAIYAAWDLAIAKHQQADFSVGVVGAMDYAGVLHVLDVIRARMDSMEIVDAILNQAAKYKVHLVGLERGQLELAIQPHLRTQMRKRRVIPAFDNTLVPVTDKLIRARPLQGMMQQGMVVFPKGQPWLDDVRSEFLRFPAGVHDDQVDAFAWLCRMCLKQPLPRPTKSKKRKSWRDKILVGVGNRSWQAS